MTQLGDLAVGQRARVVGVAGGDEIALRLLEMGITPGVDVTLLGRAPFGDPLEFEVRGYHLSVRKREAMLVEVEAL